MCWSLYRTHHATMARLASSQVPYESPLVRLSDVGWMFLQDHRENGQLQPDHPGDCPSLGAAGGNNSLYYQPSEPLQLHQYRRHSAREERPAAANTATRCAWSADHYDPLHKLVCMSYTVLQTLLAHMSNRSAVFVQSDQVVHASTVYLFLLPSVLSLSAF